MQRLGSSYNKQISKSLLETASLLTKTAPTLIAYEAMWPIKTSQE